MKRNLVSRGYHRHELDLFCEQIRVGDLIEFKRRGFSHWAVYLGFIEHEGVHQHCVIHRSLPPDCNDNDRSGVFFKLSSRSLRSTNDGIQIGSIQIDSINVAFGTSPRDIVLLNNELDEKWEPFPPEEIVARAMSMMYAVEQEPYSFTTNNCEHFATRCRYGRRYSRQIIKGVAKVATTVAGVAASMAWRAAWRVALPAVIAATTAAGITTGPVALAAIGALPTIAGAFVSAAPTVAHAIETRRGRHPS